jgi:5-formaminoimidazole-4-carboxamide-1-(beta)-D-ribofuranosyl 5'-monophosphate synthetase
MTIERSEIQELTSKYGKPSIGVLGSHSAEEVAISAKCAGLKTVVVCQKGREELYAKYNRFLFDEVILLDRFEDIIDDEVQDRLRELNTIFIPNRSFTVYVGWRNIEDKFYIPIYGNRYLLKTEERLLPKNQYWLIEKAGIKKPKLFSSPDEIDRLVIVKVRQKKKPLERAFFTANTPEEYWTKAEKLIREDVISEEDLKQSIIEEFVLGPRFNANFHAWALTDVFPEFDFLGFDDRRQVNLHGILNLPARDQLELNIPIKNEEIGHFGVTMRESQKPLVYKAAEKFIKVCKSEYPPGLIGSFALQGAIAYDPEDPEGKRLEFYVFDVSPRVPGSPCVGPTSPEMRRLSIRYSKVLRELGLDRIESVLDLTIMEISYAYKQGRLKEVIT